MELPCGYATEGQGVTPLAAAIECGAMRDQGFEATLAKLGDAHAVVAALVDGRTVFGNLAAPALVHGVANGAEVVLLAGGVNQQFLVGAPGTTLESIKGKPFGVSNPSDLTDFLAQVAFRRVLGADCEVRYVGGSNKRLQALLDGGIACTPLSPPAAIEARMAGCPWLYDYGELGLNFAIGGIATTTALLERQPELVKRFLRAYLEGQARYKADRAFGVGVHEKYGEVSRDVAEQTYDVTRDGFRDVPDPATGGMRMLIDFWRDAGQLPSDFSIERVVRSEPVLSVAAERGMWR